MAKRPLELSIKTWVLAAKASGEWVRIVLVLGPDEKPVYFSGHWETLVRFFREAQDAVLDQAPRSQVDNAGEIPEELSFDETTS